MTLLFAFVLLTTPLPPPPGHFREEPVPRGVEEAPPALVEDPDPWAELLWGAASLQTLLARRDYPALLVLATLGRITEAQGPHAPEGWTALVETLAVAGQRQDHPLQRCRALTDVRMGMLCALEGLAPVAPPPLARQMAEETARVLSLGSRTAPTLPPAYAATLAGGAAAWSDPFQRLAEEALERSRRTWLQAASLGEEASAHLEGVLTALVGLSPRLAPDDILEAFPTFQTLLARYPLGWSRAGFAPPHPAEVLGGYQAYVGDLMNSVRESARALGTAGTLGLGAARPADLPGSDDLMDWAGRRAFLYLASRSAALAGVEGASVERIKVVGSAASELQMGVLSFARDLATRGEKAALAALGGNLVAAAAALTGFFGFADGALGGQGAGEVRALREAVGSLREEVASRFQQLDRRWETLVSSLDQRLGTLETLVARGNEEVRSDLRQLHEEVLALGARMARTEENLLSYMQAGFDRDYQRTLVKCLEHRERFLPPHNQMDFSLFSECLADFRTRGTRDAKDALLTDQTTPTDDASLAAALEDRSTANLARRLPLLGRAAENRYGYGGLRGGRSLANPVEWSVAAEAYLRMLDEWPEHARYVTPGDLEALRSVGEELRQALNGIVEDPRTGERGTLLLRVVGDYQESVASLTQEVEALARRFQQQGLRRVPAESLLLTLEPSEAGDPVLTTPAFLGAWVPQEVRTAAVLGLEEVSLHYRLTFEDSISRENFRRRLKLFGRRHDRLVFSRATLDAELRLGDAEPLARYRASGPMTLIRTEEIAGGAESDKVKKVLERVPDARGHFFQNVWPSLAADGSAWRATAVPGNVLSRLDRAIGEELERHASQGLDNVFTAVCRPAGPPDRLSGEDQESVVRIQRALLGMTATRGLLESYLLLGLPFSVEENARLAESLTGPRALFDQRSLCGALAGGANPMRLLWIEEEPRRRAEHIEAALTEVLSSTDSSTELLPMVDRTLQGLEASVRLQRIRAELAQRTE